MFSELPDISTSLLLVAITAIAGYARGFSGFGAGLIFMPAASAWLGPQAAVATFYLLDFLTSFPLIPNAVKKADWRTVAPLAFFATLTLPLGTWTLINAPIIELRWGISALIFAMLMLLMSGWRYRRTPTLPINAAVGTFAGFLSGAFQVASPPIVTLWMSGPLRADTVRANIISFFVVSTVISGITFYAGGVFGQLNLSLLIVLTPVYGGFLWLGANKFGATSEQTFRKFVYLLIAISAITSVPALDALLR